MRIDIVSDVVCPWCLIGTRRVELALEKLGITDAEIVFHPFELDPGTPLEGVDLRERLRAKYRVDPDQMFGRVESEARASGIPLDFAKVRKSVNTIKAHTLLRHAEAKGTQRALAIALFRAYFLEGEDVGADDVLASLAEAHGFAPGETERLLADTAELEATREEARGAAASGITGVPLVLLERRLAVSGAQPVELFVQAIERTRERS